MSGAAARAAWPPSIFPAATSHSPAGEKASAHGGSVRRHENARIANPLADIPRARLTADARAHGLEHITAELQKGALVAQDPAAFEAVFRRELTHRWHQPWQLYYLVILCSMAAAVQGA